MLLKTTILLSLLSHLTLTIATCTSFTVVRNSYNNDKAYTRTDARSYRISDRVNCTGPELNTQPPRPFSRNCNSTTCALYAPANYNIRVNSTVNLTLDSTSALQNILDLAKLNTTLSPNDIDLNHTSVQSVGGAVADCIPQGQAAYFGFTPILYCIQGVVHGCSGSAAEFEGHGVEVCGPSLLAGTSYSGAITTVQTDGLNGTRVAIPANETMTTKNPAPTVPSGAAGVMKGSLGVVGVAFLGALVLMI